ALEALVEAADEVFLGAPVAVRAIPHGVAGLGGDNQLVAVAGKIFLQNAPKIDFGRAGRRAVVIGQVEVRDAVIKG
nr:hypothetical protein [Tanacetum cinerariifolium]